jgi:hypothetical protein
MAENVHNRNNEDTPANVGTGDEVEGPLQRQDINNGTGDGVERSLKGEDNNGVGQSLENVNCMPAPEDKHATDIEDNMPLNVAYSSHVQPTATPVGPTLVRLGNERRNASRRPPRHNTVARTNRNRESRIAQSNISFPRSVDGTGTTQTESPEGSSCRNRGAKRSNPSVLPFLEMYTPWGASCIPVVASHQGPEASDAEDPLVPRVKRLVRTNVGGTNTIELQNETSEVEGEVRTTCGDEDAMEGDDEHEDNDGNVCEEAPNDPDIHIQQSIGLDSSTVRRSGCLHLAPNIPM